MLDDEPSVWAVEQDVRRAGRRRATPRGLVASLRVEPYATGTVLPHERTHAGPKEGRLRLLRAARAQLEPIFLLYDGEPPVAPPEREPDLATADTRLWRLPGEGVSEAFADRQLLIADGHHRYETAVAYAAETGDARERRMMVVLVSTSDPGLEIFPTHRLFRGHDGALPPAGVGDSATPAAAVRSSRQPCPTTGPTRSDTGEGRPSPSPARRESSTSSSSIGSSGTRGSRYTADLAEAVARVDAGEFDGAFLLRATRIEDVFERARRGEVMPQKTTYFFPKLTSGLLFHPV